MQLFCGIRLGNSEWIKDKDIIWKARSGSNMEKQPKAKIQPSKICGRAKNLQLALTIRPQQLKFAIIRAFESNFQVRPYTIAPNPSATRRLTSTSLP